MEPVNLLRSLGPSFLMGRTHLGAASDQTGQLCFFNSSSILPTIFQAGNATAEMTYTWPTAGPAGNNYILASTTTGTLSWQNSTGTFAPIGAAYVTVGSDATLTAERALTGTSNQITITDNGAGSTVVLSTPQNIHTAATPTFASLSLTATTNQFVLGTTRTATITAPTPATSSRTYTFPDLSGDYSVVGTIGNQSISGIKTFSTQLIGAGTTTNDSASAGFIGEYIESVVSTFGNCTTSTQFGNITSISLTGGDWDITGQVKFTLNGATANADFIGAVSINSGNTTTDHVSGSNTQDSLPPTATNNNGVTISSYRLSLSGATTVYLKGRAGYSAGTPQMLGTIRARRLR